MSTSKVVPQLCCDMKLPRQPSSSRSPSDWSTTRAIHSFSIRNLCVLTASIHQPRGLEFFVASSGLTPPKWLTGGSRTRGSRLDAGIPHSESSCKSSQWQLRIEASVCMASYHYSDLATLAMARTWALCGFWRPSLSLIVHCLGDVNGDQKTSCDGGSLDSKMD